MDKKGSSGILIAVGFILLIIGIIVAVLTVSGYMGKAVNGQFVPAISGYFIGIFVAIFFIVIGGVLLILGLR